MKPITAKDLLELDKRLEVEVLQCYPIPEQVIWQAAKNDYSEVPIHNIEVPPHQKCGEWIVDQLLANERGHYGCYSSDTQVLTESGWVYWPTVTKSTVLAAYDVKTRSVNFETPTAVQLWDYKGKMYNLEGPDIDFLVSPDHRMIAQIVDENGYWSDGYAISAEDVFNKPVRYQTSGILSRDERAKLETPIDHSRFWELLGFWFSVGCINESSNTLYFRLSTPSQIKYLNTICLDIGVSLCPTDQDGMYVVLHPSIGDWVIQNCLDFDSEKCLPAGYLRLGVPRVYMIFKGLMYHDVVDGSHSTTSSVLVSQLQAIAAINGISLNCVEELDANKNPNGVYFLRFSVGSAVTVESINNTQYNEQWVNYDGQIHCATVSTGALIVRRNGKVAICGNCLEHPQITLSCSGFVHNVVVQARTHRIGTTWDVQSQRYTGKRVVKVASQELNIEDVFYVRPPGFYTNRQGKKYEWTEDNRHDELNWIFEGCRRYALKYEQGMCEEHIRDYLPQAIRQNFVVSFNLRSVLHFMDLRSKLDAQLEIQALCDSFVPKLQRWAPNVWKYYEEKRLHKARLSP
jgi:thymidylate synthase (FAD)